MKWRIAAVIGLLSFISTTVYSQTREITGTVSSDDGQGGLPGVTILIKGKSQGTTTDFDGDYSISALPTDTLVFSFIGYKPLSKVVGNRTVIPVELTLDVEELAEVVVIGYGTIKKSDLTGSVGSLKVENLENRAVTQVEQALSGQIAGVQVTQSNGMPGAPITIRVRGIGTVNNADPLYVVDGILLTDISFLNPADIKSLEVLKDASATAIYGSRGANGVVLISTRSGNMPNKTTVVFNSYMGVQDLWRVPGVTDRDGFVQLVNESRLNAGQTIYEDFEESNIQNLDNTDWVDAITRKAMMQDHYLSVSGGSGKNSYSLSVGSMKQDGIILSSQYARQTARLSLNSQVNKFVQAGANVGFASSKRKLSEGEGEASSNRAGPLLGAMSADPTMPIRREDGEFQVLPNTGTYNPVANLNYFDNDIRENRVVGSLFAEVTFFEGLKYNGNFGITLANKHYKEYDHTFDMSIPGVPWDRPTSLLTQKEEESFRYTINNILTFSKKIDKHDFSIMVGRTAEQATYEFVNVVAGNTPSNRPEDQYIESTDGNGAVRGYLEKSDAIISYLARAIYSYDGKYLMTASYRKDYSNKFIRENIGAGFPSFSLGWNISKEGFMQNISGLDFLKIRAGWGQVGNQNIPNFAYTSLVYKREEGQGSIGSTGNHGFDYPFGGKEKNGSVNVNAENPNVTWETTEQINLGTDAEFLDGKISFSADYFIKDTERMLLTVPLPGSVGVSGTQVNAGSVRNTGIELTLSHKNRINDFNYDISGNITFIDNEVISLGNGDALIGGGGVTRTDVGYDISSFWGWSTAGVFQDEKQIEEYNALDGDATTPYQNGAAPGDLIFKDINGKDENGNYTGVPDGKIDDADQQVIGSPIPDFTFGVNINASYKAFDFTLSLQGVYGNELYYNQLWALYFNSRTNFSDVALNRWTPEKPSNTYPRLTNSDANNNQRDSDFFVKDGSFMRLKNVQLGYNLPTKLINKIGVQKFRIYVAAQNLFTFTKYEGFDPEIGQSDKNQNLAIGIDNGSYPLSRVFFTGVNLTF